MRLKGRVVSPQLAARERAIQATSHGSKPPLQGQTPQTSKQNAACKTQKRAALCLGVIRGDLPRQCQLRHDQSYSCTKRSSGVQRKHREFCYEQCESGIPSPALLLKRSSCRRSRTICLLSADSADFASGKGPLRRASNKPRHVCKQLLQ